MDYGVQISYAKTLSPGYDAYVFPGVLAAEVIPSIRELKKNAKIIWMIDDMWTFPPWNYYKSNWGYALQYCLEEMENLADYKVVTTKPLQEINPGSFYCPNLMPPDCFVERQKPFNDSIVWAGSGSHEGDLQEIVPFVNEEQHDFIFFGDKPEQGVTSTRVGYARSVAVKYVLPALRYLNCGIGLCPLANHAFNIYKSPLKWLEYSAVGMATVATDLDPYQVIKDGETGVLLRPGETWAEGVSRVKPEMGSAAFEEVKSEWSWAGPKRQLWIDTYRKISS